MDKKSTFITIEGIHGAGKSTIARLITNELRKLEVDFVLTVNQSGTELGKKIRKINAKGNYNVDTLTEALLVAAACRQTIAEIIKPNLSQGKIVISERYSDAYLAFQGFARGLPMGFLNYVNSIVSEGIEPDLTILLDIEPEIAFTRLDASTMHRIEKEPLEFHKKLRDGYLAQANKFPNRIKTVDAALSTQAVFQQVWKIVKGFLALGDTV